MDTKIIAALIAGVFSLLSPIVKWWLENKTPTRQSRHQGSDPVLVVSQRKPLNWRVVAAFALVGTVFGYILGLIFSGSVPKPLLSTPGFPTPIPRGDLVMEIDFNQPGVGGCNAYDPSLLGYEDNQYYIQPKSNGYIAVCHERTELPSEGSLQVSAWSNGEINDIYGFAVLFGWRGEGVETTDMCLVGIRRQGSTTQAFYSSRVNGKREAYTKILNSVQLDNALHTLRVVLQPDGKAIGYLDERYFVEYQFEKCSAGPVGVMAWGQGNQKIYFDDLKLFDLP